MHIVRHQYISKLHQAIYDGMKVILLHGGRGSWKTTLLKDLMADNTISQKKYYFSFEEDIVSKRFSSVDDFIGYMQMKYGIDFQSPNLLLLNEIQYSKRLLTIFHDLLQSKDIKTQIIATGIIQEESTEYKMLAQSSHVRTVIVHPLSFFDFLDVRNIHTTYLSLDKPSPVVFKELQNLFDEYLIWGGYPAVVTASTQDRKQQTLRAIIQKVYDKDVGFCFNGDEILLFQDLMQTCCRQTMKGYTLKSLARDLEIGLPLLKKYIQFLVDNCLVHSMSYFFTNKARELCHQEHVVIGDTGLVSYMTQNFGSKLHDLAIIKNFVFAELTKYVADTDQIMTYKKINNSMIDFVIVHEDGMLTPVMVSEKNTFYVPKIYHGFHEQYGDRVRRYIKTTSLTVSVSSFEGKEFVCLPHFLISKAVRQYNS